MGRYLVTGGAGFIGSHVVDELCEAGHEVVVVDLLDPSAHSGRPNYLHPAATYHFGDVRDRTVLSAESLRAFDGVSHQAAKVGLGVDLRDVEAYVGHNDQGTAALLAGLFTAGFAGRLVLASSMVVYGEGRYVCPDHGTVPAPPRAVADLAAGRFEPPCPWCGRDLQPQPVPEDAPLDPRNVYAATKLHQEHLCSAFSRETGVAVVALRYHNVYGARMPRDTPYAGVASIFLSRVAAGEPPLVFEDGGQTRDFVHVRDVARANVSALVGDDAVRGPFNVASGDPRTIGDMATQLAAPARLLPQVTGQYRLGDVRHVFASPDRAASVLGFRAEVSFADGMADLGYAELRDPPAR